MQFQQIFNQIQNKDLNKPPLDAANQQKNDNLEQENIKLKKENDEIKTQMQQLMNQLMQQKNEYEAQLSSNALELKKLQDKIHEIEQKDREKESNMNHASPHIQQKPKEIKILDLNDIKNLEKISEIGSGGGGKVYKISMKITCALKEMNVKNKTIEDLRRFIAEYEIMNMLDHPNILKALGIFFGDNEEEEAPKIVLEYCPNNLESAIKEKSLNNVQIALCIYQIVEGMKYVHHQKIIQ